MFIVSYSNSEYEIDFEQFLNHVEKSKRLRFHTHDKIKPIGQIKITF